MTGEQLRDELTRIADAAPEVHVEHDLFDRGRRAHRQAQVLVAGAVVACLALVAGIGWQVTRGEPAPITEGETRTGVPEHIYAPPLGERSIDLGATPLDKVGVAVAAYLVEDAAATVELVSPEGDYQGVRLPDLFEPMRNDVSPVLSPDGRALAYSTQDDDNSRGLAVVDLTTGTVRRVLLAPGDGAVVRTLQWSPDSRWLTWSGQVVRSSTESGGASYGRTVGGTIAPGATTSTPLPRVGGEAWDGAGICNDGAAVRYVYSAFFVSAGGRDPVRHGTWRSATAGHGTCSAPHAIVPGTRHPLTRVVGWLPGTFHDVRPTAVVITPDWVDRVNGSFQGMHLRLVGPEGGAKDVGHVESAWTLNTSIATGFMTVDQPTVPAGHNPWDRPFWVDHPFEIVAGGVVVLVIGAAVVGAVRSRRVSARPGRPAAP